MTKNTGINLAKSDGTGNARSQSHSLKTRNVEILHKVDIMEGVAELQWQWVGHIVRQDQSKYATRVIHWRPMQNERSVGRPNTRWLDDINHPAGIRWYHVEQDKTA